MWPWFSPVKRLEMFKLEDRRLRCWRTGGRCSQLVILHGSMYVGWASCHCSWKMGVVGLGEVGRGNSSCLARSYPHFPCRNTPTPASPPADIEQQSATELAATTGGRYYEPERVAYRIPTAHYHFQSADALALATEYGGAKPAARAEGAAGGASRAAGGGGRHGRESLLLATFDRQGVAAWLVPASGALQVGLIV